MKVSCDVQLSNRNLSEHNMKSSFPFSRSTLSVGRTPKTNEIFLLYQTMKNKQGTKYKVKDNLEQVFVKFLKEGKATIRFRTPPHDLSIKGDPLQLKSFFTVLRMTLCAKGPVDSLPLLTAERHTSKIEGPKTDLIITSRAEYPTIQGFPRTLKRLQVNNSELKRVDPRILRLHCLRILDLSRNNLTEIPESFNELPLVELNLAHNQLGIFPWKPWWWLGGKLNSTLRLLDLSNNQIQLVPPRLFKVQALTTIKLDHNKIRKLPTIIGFCRTLRNLTLSHNEIDYIPGTVQNIHLDYLDLSGNPFRGPAKLSSSSSKLVVPSLKDCAARKVLEIGIFLTPEMLPRTLLQYLDSADYCLNGDPLFEVTREITHEISLIAHTLITDGGINRVPAVSLICATSCTGHHCS